MEDLNSTPQPGRWQVAVGFDCFWQRLTLPTHRLVLATAAAPVTLVARLEAVVDRLVHDFAPLAPMKDEGAGTPHLFQLASIQSHVLARFRFLVFRYSSMARRISSFTGAPVSWESAFMLACWSSRT
jgi:hypothetical protein